MLAHTHTLTRSIHLKRNPKVTLWTRKNEYQSSSFAFWVNTVCRYIYRIFLIYDTLSIVARYESTFHPLLELFRVNKSSRINPYEHQKPYFFPHGVQFSIENFLHLSLIFGSDGWRTEHKIQKQQRMSVTGKVWDRTEKTWHSSQTFASICAKSSKTRDISWYFRLQWRPIGSYQTNRLWDFNDFNLTNVWDFNCWCLHQRCVFDCCDRPREGSGSVYPDLRAHSG